jgi:hypothetical protein
MNKNKIKESIIETLCSIRFPYNVAIFINSEEGRFIGERWCEQISDLIVKEIEEK